MSEKICDRHCFSCEYEDCILSEEELTAEEYRQTDARDRQALESREGYSKDRAGKTTPQLSYYYRNIERCRANSRKYYADHREELLAKKKAERRAHRDFYRAKDAIYRQRKREERLAERARQSGEKSENSDEQGVRATRSTRSGNQAKQALYGYMEDKRRLQEIEAAALGRKGGEAGRSKGPGDPTGRAAVRLAMDDERAELRRRVEAVDRALAWVPLELHKPVAGHILAIAEAVYFRRRVTLYGYAAKAGVSEKTAQRWNKMLLQRVEEEIKKAPIR